VLELVQRYPTAQLLARASADDLGTIPYLPDHHRDALLEHARHSIAGLSGAAVEELVRDQVRQLRDVSARQKHLENLLGSAYHDLPAPNYLNSIHGIGDVTAAVLTAFILDSERFATPNQLVAYFGVLPIEVSSGVERDGQARGPRRSVMSARGNDLVRRSLWMAALSAIRCNPAVRPLYQRLVAKHPDQKAIAVGHAMRKLLHLVFAIWKTGKAFDAAHYPWQQPAHVEGADNPPEKACRADTPGTPSNQAAGHKPETKPASPVVTAAWKDNLADSDPLGDGTFLDFSYLKRQLTLSQVLDHLGLCARLRGSGPQRRGPCPIHRGDGRGRTFSVNLDENVFQCFDARCAKKGDVIDLWAGVKGLSLRAAALDLVRTFALEPAPRCGTEKRHG
jgi:hypothetical protein